MPIRPADRHFYEGPKWEAARRLVLKRAHDKCECEGECGEHKDFRCNRADRTEYRNKHNRLVFVVLQIAHVNHTPGDDRLENLRAWCPECHIRHDTPKHKRAEAVTRREARNNQELFPEDK